MRLTGYGLLLWALVLSESNGGAIALAWGSRSWSCCGATAGGLARVLARRAGGRPGRRVFLTALPLNKLRQLAATSSQPLLVNSIGRSGQSSSERTC